MDLLLIDSDVASTQKYQQLFNTYYQVVTCYSAAEFFERFEHSSIPPIVILEASLPDISGYQLCCEIKSRAPNTLILFLSAFDETDDIAKAYDCGADDYLTKPCTDEILFNRVRALLNINKRSQELLSKTEEAENLALRSLKEISEYGLVLRLVRESFTKSDIKQIINNFFDYIQQFGLHCSIQINSLCGNYCMQGIDLNSSPIELKLFELMRQQGRIYKFNGRMIVNDNKVSLLIKNLPQDEFDNGRYTDLFCIVVELLNAKICELEKEQKLSKSQHAIKSVCSNISSKLQNAEELDSDQLSTMSKAIEQVERAFDFMDLSDDEELLFRDLFDTYHSELESLSSFLDAIKRQLLDMNQALEL